MRGRREDRVEKMEGGRGNGEIEDRRKNRVSGRNCRRERCAWKRGMERMEGGKRDGKGCR